MTTTNSANRTLKFDHSLIAKESFYIGEGDDKPYWYCCECGYRKSDVKPAENTVCGHILLLYSKEKLRSTIIEFFPFYENVETKEQIEKEIERYQWDFRASFQSLYKNLEPKWKTFLAQVKENYFIKSGEIEDFWKLTLDEILKDMLVLYHNGDNSFLKEEKKCRSMNFKLEQNHGNLIEVRYGEWLQLYDEITKNNK